MTYETHTPGLACSDQLTTAHALGLAGENVQVDTVILWSSLIYFYILGGEVSGFNPMAVNKTALLQHSLLGFQQAHSCVAAA